MTFTEEQARRSVEAQFEEDSNGAILPTGRYVDFPVESLPEVLRRFIWKTSEAYQCDAALIALPALATIAGAIGNARTLHVHDQWQEACALWTLTVSIGGTLKSTLLQVATRPTLDYDKQLALENKDAFAQWQDDKVAAKSSKQPEPPKPPCHTVVLDDTTLEHVALVLSENPKGVLIWSTELGNWIGNFARYSGSRADADASAWNKMYDGAFWKQSRMTRDTVVIPRALASVAACVQPKILPTMLTEKFSYLGFNARFLIAQPPTPQRRRRNAVDHDEHAGKYRYLVRQLHHLDMLFDQFGQPQPHRVCCTPEAADCLEGFYVSMGHQAEKYANHIAGPLVNRIQGHAARLALVLQLAECPDASSLDAAAAQAGVELAKWFLREGLRICELGSQQSSENRAKELDRWVQDKQGGSCTVRDVLTYNWKYKREGTEGVREQLIGCINLGLGYWDHGRKTDLYVSRGG